MLTFLVKAVKILISIVMAIATIFTPITGRKMQKIQHYKDGCNASFGVISDVHIKDNFIRQGMLELGFADMEKAKDKLDAVVFNGDITDHGYIDMWDCFAESVGRYNIAKQTIIVTGNHDTWGPDRDNLDTVKQTFIDYNKSISNRNIDNIYYTANINGYPVIVLGSEDDSTAATVSQAQVDWFAAEMKKASTTGLPIFVFMHHPINGTHGLPYNWELNKEHPFEKGGIGDKSDDIFNIIKQYKNVFYISGHIHAGHANEKSHTFYSSIEKYDGYTLVNSPCYMYPDVQHGGNLSNGTGYVFEVYDNDVMIRARNFATGRWLTQYDEVIPIN